MTCPCVRYRPEWQCDCDGPLTEEERARNTEHEAAVRRLVESVPRHRVIDTRSPIQQRIAGPRY